VSDAQMSDESKAIAEAIMAKREWPVTVKLAYPIEFGKDEMIHELVFQRGNMGMLEGLKVDDSPSASEVLLIASRLCGKPVAALRKLDPDDAPEVVAIAMAFFVRCLGAGKK